MPPNSDPRRDPTSSKQLDRSAVVERPASANHSSEDKQGRSRDKSDGCTHEPTDDPPEDNTENGTNDEGEEVSPVRKTLHLQKWFSFGGGYLPTAAAERGHHEPLFTGVLGHGPTMTPRLDVVNYTNSDVTTAPLRSWSEAFSPRWVASPSLWSGRCGVTHATRQL